MYKECPVLVLYPLPVSEWQHFVLFNVCIVFYKPETGVRVLFTVCFSHFIKTINLILYEEILERFSKDFCKKPPKISFLQILTVTG